MPTSLAWLQADLRDERLVEPALAVTTRLFLLTDNAPGFGETQLAIIRAAEQLGVKHVVKLSALGASNHSNSSIAREHWEVEQALQRSTMAWTLLRPHALMQNWLGDVAEILTRPEAHADRKYFLTGGDAVSYADLAAALSEATGRDVRYHAISMDEARVRAEQHGTPPALIDAMLAIAAYQKAGGPTEKTSDGVQRILGRPPRTIADFARDYREEFINGRARAATGQLGLVNP